jgi:hypothetical protein
MSSDWSYYGNGLIKKIYSQKNISHPYALRWFVVLYDDLHVRLQDEKLNELPLTSYEKEKLEEARNNCKKLSEKRNDSNHSNHFMIF